MSAKATEIANLITTIQDVFLDSPELTLSVTSARRRFGADRATCLAVLDALVDAQVLEQTRDGSYVRHYPRLAHAA